jgi:hypothetical protein
MKKYCNVLIETNPDSLFSYLLNELYSPDNLYLEHHCNDIIYRFYHLVESIEINYSGQIKPTLAPHNSPFK